MTDSDSSPLSATFIDAPRHPGIRDLRDYWSAKRGSRTMPARSDINPAELKPLLPNVMIWAVQEPGPYTIVLVGDAIVAFVGVNNTGKPATFGMPPEAAVAINIVLTKIVQSRAPLFRTGKAIWSLDNSYRDFEACFLPLSPDDDHVDKILGGVFFDVTAAT